jgi:hypothetical protein
MIDRLFKAVYQELSDRLGVNLTADPNYVPDPAKRDSPFD